MELTYKNLMELGKEYVKERTMSYASFAHLDFFVWLRQREEIEADQQSVQRIGSTYLLEIDDRAVLVVAKQYDVSGDEVSISNINIPTTPEAGDGMNFVEEIDNAIGAYEEGAWTPESEEIVKLVGLLSRARKTIAGCLTKDSKSL